MLFQLSRFKCFLTSTLLKYSIEYNTMDISELIVDLSRIRPSESRERLKQLSLVSLIGISSRDLNRLPGLISEATLRVSVTMFLSQEPAITGLHLCSRCYSRLQIFSFSVTDVDNQETVFT